MNKLFIILLIVLLASCCGKHTEVKYEYDGVVITRVDKCAETTFYYGKEQSESSGRIWAEYSGINDGFAAYLIFDNKGKVTLLPSDGYFKSEGLDKTQFELDTAFYYDSPKGDLVYKTLLSTRYEQERNKENKSKITATYKIDDNEWW